MRILNKIIKPKQLKLMDTNKEQQQVEGQILR